MKIDLISNVYSLSKAQNIISPALGAHQPEVAYLAYRLADELNLDKKTKNQLLFAGLLHDIGALSLQEKFDVIRETSLNINTHAFRGAYILKEFAPLSSAARYIKYHHFNWHYGKTYENYPDIPKEAQILHLADRVCSLISKDSFILSQVTSLTESIKSGAGTAFPAEYVKAFLSLAKRESFWLDLVSEDPISNIDLSLVASVEIEIDELISLARIYSYLIDFRSPFTSRHSASVAGVAVKLAELMCFSPYERKKMLVAGYLHDLGKLTIDNDILEKQSALSPEEFDAIRSHTYYTYKLLSYDPAFSEIREWSAYHHERLNGAGYPFHIGDSELSLGARIMAVADVFSALCEKRPYKDAMPKDKVCSILLGMVDSGSLDKNIVDKIIDNFEVCLGVCSSFGEEAVAEYGKIEKITAEALI